MAQLTAHPHSHLLYHRAVLANMLNPALLVGASYSTSAVSTPDLMHARTACSYEPAEGRCEGRKAKR
eukprot:6210544-Pleurochrysis_carterae.AAC.5